MKKIVFRVEIIKTSTSPLPTSLDMLFVLGEAFGYFPLKVEEITPDDTEHTGEAI